MIGRRRPVVGRKGAMVPVLWGMGALGALLTLAGALGADVVILGLWGGAICIVTGFGLAVHLSRRRHPLPTQQYAVRSGGGAAAWGAATIGLGAMVPIFGLWFVPCAVAAAFLCVHTLVAARRTP